jgi:hypothetical protein
MLSEMLGFQADIGRCVSSFTDWREFDGIPEIEGSIPFGSAVFLPVALFSPFDRRWSVV